MHMVDILLSYVFSTNPGIGAFSGCDRLPKNKYDNAYYLGNANNPYLVLLEAQSQDITSCVINSNTKIVADDAFYKCSKLTSISIPNSVTSIGDSAFSNCYSLTSISIPVSVTSIGDSAFYYCSSLTIINIPEGVTSIGDEAFYGCDSLRTINFTGTVAQWKAIKKGSNWNQYAGSFTVICTDGKLDKNGNVIQ